MNDLYTVTDTNGEAVSWKWDDTAKGYVTDYKGYKLTMTPAKDGFLRWVIYYEEHCNWGGECDGMLIESAMRMALFQCDEIDHAASFEGW